MRRVSQKKCLHGEWFFVSNNIFIENFHDVKFLTFCNFIYLIFLIWYWIFYLCWQWRWIGKIKWYKHRECHERSSFMVSDSSHEIIYLIYNLHFCNFLSFLIFILFPSIFNIWYSLCYDSDVGFRKINDTNIESVREEVWVILLIK